jgi:hypothetical protein
MNNKLMLLVAGALAALAFTALPGAASAKETALKCENTNCTFAVHGGVSEFSATPSGDTVKCETVTGSGGAINLVNLETTTTQVQLTFLGCREQNTVFKFTCTTPGLEAGKIESNVITSHNIALPGVGTENGVLFTDSKGTFTCAGGLAKTTVTGNVIGENEKKCGEPASKEMKFNFAVTGHGKQSITTYTGATFNLISATNHNATPATSSYETSAAQKGTGILTWNQNVQVTCAT